MTNKKNPQTGTLRYARQNYMSVVKISRAPSVLFFLSFLDHGIVAGPAPPLVSSALPIIIMICSSAICGVLSMNSQVQV